MIPAHLPSSTPVPSPIQGPKGLTTTFTEDYELGGVALNDGSQGLQVQTWKAWASPASGGSILVQPLNESLPAVAVRTGLGDVTMVSISFDRNMNPAVAYMVKAGSVETQYLYWYDSITAAMVTTSFPGARDGRVVHDDNRAESSATSDVIFSYLKGTYLHWREQRDRYTIEYTVADNIPTTLRLRNVGMGANRRLQWVMGKRGGSTIGS